MSITLAPKITLASPLFDDGVQHNALLCVDASMVNGQQFGYVQLVVCFLSVQREELSMKVSNSL